MQGATGDPLLAGMFPAAGCAAQGLAGAVSRDLAAHHPCLTMGCVTRHPFGRAWKGAGIRMLTLGVRAHSNPSNVKGQTVGQDDCVAAWKACLAVGVGTGEH